MSPASRVSRRLLALLATAALTSAAPVGQAVFGSSFGVPNVNATYDYIIVGGGTTGLTLASRLAEDPTKLVAVVEAGGFYEITNGNFSQLPGDDIRWTSKSPTDVNPLVDWGFTTIPQPGAYGAVIHYARGKTLGGCSARNFMAYTRSTKQAYQQWADQVGDSSYNFNSLSPYFLKSTNFTAPDISKRGVNATPQYDTSTVGTSGPLDITYPNYAQPVSTWVQKGMAAIGIPPINGLTSGTLMGSSWLLNTINHTVGLRESSETAYLDPALSRPNLIVYTDTLAKNVLFKGKNASGVVVNTAGYTYTLTAKKEVILSAGTFQSPQLLMVSGIGPKATLQQHNIPVVSDLEGVGQNMWDHVLFGPSYRVNVQTASSLAMGNNYFKNNALFAQSQSGTFASPGGDFLGFEKVPQSLRQKFTPSALQDLATFPADWPELEYFSVGAYFGNQWNYLTGAPEDGYQYATVAASIMAPMSRGNISISSADTADQPLINPNWLTHPTDQQVAVAAYKRIRAMWASEVMQKGVVIGQEYFPGLNVSTDAEILDLIRQSFNTVSHPTSTCKMGKTGDSSAVVDTRGRVFGVSNLRVVDASILPFLPPGMPQGTLYALAEKIADNIRNGS